MKTFNGKAIYQPKNKAAEYAKYACNFYVNCSNSCSYCYLRKGVLAHTMGGNTPKLKACFKNEQHALEVFEKELKANLPELQKHGLFFSFSTDPMLNHIINDTTEAVMICLRNDIPVNILTKRAEWIDRHGTWAEVFSEKRYFYWFIDILISKAKKLIAFGFTLTGHDEMETGASTNAERIEAMRKLHDAGFKTWASIEPIIDFESSLRMIKATMGFCDLYKIGLESGKKYNRHDINVFIERCFKYSHLGNLKIYFKDSLLKAAGINREDLPANCVSRDFNMFNN
jgi:DNA repair photolyase